MSPPVHSPPSDSRSPHLPRFPAGSELWVLLIGVMAGLAAGPWCLGRLAPAAYDRVIVTYFGPRAAAADHELHTASQLETLERSGVSKVAIDEFVAERREALSTLVQSSDAALEAGRQTWRTGVLFFLSGVLISMAVEAIVPRRHQAGRRFAAAALRVRYGLAAVVIAILLAVPGVLI